MSYQCLCECLNRVFLQWERFINCLVSLAWAYCILRRRNLWLRLSHVLFWRHSTRYSSQGIIRIVYMSLFRYLLLRFSNELCLFNAVSGYCREQSTQAILQALRDETLNDPRDRIEIAQSHAFYRPSLLDQPWFVSYYSYNPNCRFCCVKTSCLKMDCCYSLYNACTVSFS